FPDDTYDRIWQKTAMAEGLNKVKSDTSMITVDVEDHPPKSVIQSGIVSANFGCINLYCKRALNNYKNQVVTLAFLLRIHGTGLLVILTLASRTALYLNGLGLSGTLPDFSSMDALQKISAE
ncbi:hypothetical protein GIB67_008194, partial [Kingdonia uniflora]